MADEAQYASGIDVSGAKRKYEEQTPPPPPPPAGPRRPTGFSSVPVPGASPESGAMPPPPPSYNSVPPPLDEIQMAKQKAQEIAARLLSGADAKRPRVENGASFDSVDKGLSSGPSDGKPMLGSAPSTIPVSYGSFQGTSKKIEIPNIRVGVIIGKGGETIKYLQLQSGAKIQVTRDMDADPNAPTRMVELMGTPEQIAKAEQLINEVLQEAEAGGSGVVSRRITGQTGSEQFVMRVPNNKVGLVIGKGGETIKSMQAKSGARIQVIPLHLPPGDTSTERTVQIDGTGDQIEHAKQLVNEVISGESRLRNPSMGGGYPQSGYQSRPVAGWGPPGAPPMQQPGYGYMQPGAYPGPTPQYNMSQSPYGGYPPQSQGGYPPNWDPSSMPPSQQPTPGGGYDYYNQQPSTQQAATGGSSIPVDASAYNYYNQPSGYGQQMQGYGQDGYGGYNVPPHPGYGQAQSYDQQVYGSASGYGGSVNNATREGQYSSQGDSTLAPPAGQPGTQQYGSGQQPSPNPSGYPQGNAQTAYAAGYGSQPPPVQPGYGQGYGAQKPVGGYGQAQQSPNAASGGYGLPPPPQTGAYPHSQAPPSGFAQPPDSGAPQTTSVPSGYAQQGYSAPPYGAPPPSHQGYAQVPPAAYNASYGVGYGQAGGSYTDGSTSVAGSQSTQPAAVTKTSPES